MSPIPVPDDDASAEISLLIRALRQADQRIDDLTAGEVDTVADRDGRSFMLQHAQGEMRYAEAARQAAILNALPAHIVLLDSLGVIVSLNDAWRLVTRGNMLVNAGCTIGISYLEVCDLVRGETEMDARRVAAGIRSVLSGSARQFSLEYSCTSHGQQSWFLVSVTPLNAGHPAGVVVMHLDVTEQKRGEERSRRFSTAMDAIVDSIYLVDRTSMQFVHVNDAACRMQNKTRAQLLAIRPELILGTSREELERTYDDIIGRGSDSKPLELHRRRFDGSSMWVEVRRQPQHSGEGWTVVTLIRDVTDRKAAENRIAYLNRVYAMLSGINALIVRVHDRDELFKEACRIAVDEGGFHLAMIGVVARGTMTVVTVGLAGKNHTLLALVKEKLGAANGAATAMTVRAITTKLPVVANDSQNDAAVAYQAMHVQFGCRSMAIFPLLIANEVVGALSLYADEIHFFHEEEVKLLTQLTSDVAFATDHIEKKERLAYLASYDVLTGLANRALFLERVGQFLVSATAAARTVTLVLIDLRRFRNINESLGRAAGDVLLTQVAQWLTSNAGAANQLARVGVDHFAVVLPEAAADGGVARYIETMIRAFLEHQFTLDGTQLRIAAKIGIASFPGDGSDADTLLRHAEIALQKAKAGGDRYLFYTQAMNTAIAGKLTLENQLHQALDKEQFVLYYQPKVNLATGLITGAEALIRWNDPESGLVPPALFIPLLEETGMIQEVGRWVLRKAIADYTRWRAAGLAAVRIAVNVSPLQLRDRNFVHEVERATALSPLAAAGLELEITESVIMEDIKRNIGSLRAVRDMGVTIAIDDFGTGFSSLSYLAKLPVNTLKIDQSFVTDMTSAPEGQVLVAAIIKLAHALHLNVVAEGVETGQQARLLQSLDCDEMQGYLFCRPVPSSVFEARYLAPGSMVPGAMWGTAHTDFAGKV